MTIEIEKHRKDHWYRCFGITPAKISKNIAKKYSAVSTYKEFENHTHWVIGEDGWEEIAAFISDWMD